MEQVLNKILIMSILSTVCTHAEKKKKPLGFKGPSGALLEIGTSERSSNNFRAPDEGVTLSCNCSCLFWNQLCTYNNENKVEL